MPPQSILLLLSLLASLWLVRDDAFAMQSIESSSSPSSSSSFGASKEKKPNIMLVIIDDMPTWGISSLLSKDHPLSKIDFAPNLKKFAMEEAVTFDSAFAQEAVCNPSRASFLTSRFPTQLQLFNKVRATGLPDIQKKRVPLLTKIMKLNGYKVFGTGKVFHKEAPWLFNKFINTETQNTACNGKISCAPQNEKKLVDYKVTTNAIKLIKAAAGSKGDNANSDNKPFFLAVGYHRPHSKFSGSKKSFTIVETAKLNVTNEEGVFPIISRLSPKAKSENMIPNFASVSSTMANDPIVGIARAWAYKQALAGSIQWVDECFGLLVSALKELRLWDDLVVVVIGDNGQMSGERSMTGKSVLFEPSKKIPFLLRNPKYPASFGKVSGGLVELVDVLPTLSDIAGLPQLPYDYPRKAIGKSLQPIVQHLNNTNNDKARNLVSLRLGAITEEFRCTVKEQVLNNNFLKGREYKGEWFACAKESIPSIPRNRADMIGLSFRTGNWSYVEWRSTYKRVAAGGDGGVTLINYDSASLWGRELYDYRRDDGLNRVDGVFFEQVNLAPCPVSCYPRYSPRTKIKVDAMNYDWVLENDIAKLKYGPPDLQSTKFPLIVESLSLALRAFHRDGLLLCSGHGLPNPHKKNECLECIPGWKGSQCEIPMF